MSAICIATGPSLTLCDVNKCKQSGRTIYAINDAYKLAPWADYLYACDGDWWDYHEGVKDFKGERWTTSDAAALKWGLNHAPGTPQKLFATEYPMAYGKNSGFQAINLAFLHGHRDIWLLGYDLGFEKDTKKHFFGEHPRGVDRPSQFPEWIEHYRKAAPIMKESGLSITNMTRTTALECFERDTL